MTPDQRWLGRQAGGLLIAGIALLLIFELSHLDLAISAWVFNPESRQFPLQHHWLFEQVLHHAFKGAAYGLGIVGILFCLYAVRHEIPWFSRRQACLAASGTLLIPLLTTLLKQLTNRHCPWDVVDFGGYAPYVSLFATTPADIVQGRCFPAGHAAAGFVWLVWFLALRSTRPRWANWACYGGVCAGALAGLDRLMQGAHFLSHVLWSAWLAWGVSIALCWVFQVPQGRR